MAGFVKAMRTEEADFLDKYPIANHVLNVIARRARRTPCKMTGLDVGECFIGHKGLGITEQQYRTAKKQLTKWDLVEFKRGKRATDVGTVAKLINSRVYDINETEGNGSLTEEERKPNGKVTTNKECNNETMEEDKDLVGDERQPKECFDYGLVKYAWNKACDSMKVKSTKCRIVSEATKKNLPKTYSKYCKDKKELGSNPAERHKWCEDFFRAVLDKASEFVGREGPHQDWKPNLEYASKIKTYDQVMEWIYDKRS